MSADLVIDVAHEFGLQAWQQGNQVPNDSFSQLAGTAEEVIIKVTNIGTSTVYLSMLDSINYVGITGYNGVNLSIPTVKVPRSLAVGQSDYVKAIITLNLHTGGLNTGTSIRDERNYLASHGDLIETFGYNPQSALDHYLAFGSKEGRTQHGFNAAEYVENYTDLQNAYGLSVRGLTEHYIRHGYHEKRNYL